MRVEKLYDEIPREEGVAGNQSKIRIINILQIIVAVTL